MIVAVSSSLASLAYAAVFEAGFRRLSSALRSIGDEKMSCVFFWWIGAALLAGWASKEGIQPPPAAWVPAGMAAILHTLSAAVGLDLWRQRGTHADAAPRKPISEPSRGDL